MALPLLAMQEIKFAFEGLMEQAPAALSPLIQYFKKLLDEISVH